MKILPSFVKSLLILFLFVTGCGDYGDYGESITSPVIISNTQHHVGDNDGAEGLMLTADFEMPRSFQYAELSITFPYPDAFGTSGFDVDNPPEIKINGNKVGIWSNQLTQYTDCIDSDRSFVCPITFTYDITSYLTGGTNTFSIRTVAYWDNYDDFAFSNVSISFE